MSNCQPDNRRPVDYNLRRRLLAELEETTPEAIWARVDEGLPKLWMTSQALHLRRRRPQVFGPAGKYQPLQARGSRAEHVVAFAREGKAITVVPRLVLQLGREWGDTVLDLPAGRWCNVLTGDELQGGPVRVGEVLTRFPIGLLSQEEATA